EHRRAWQTRGDRVHEMRELRPKAVEQARHGPHHPRLLEARPQLYGTDAVRYQLRTARHRREVEVARQCAEQLAHVRLVAGAVTAERVGVDDDHAASSYACSRRRADSSHE